MNRRELIDAIRAKQSFLCVGLDSDSERLPECIRSKDFPQYEFNKVIIENTVRKAVAYKINTAFYEAEGINGWTSLEKTVLELPEDVFKIADAKRGDIGNTSRLYAKAFFDRLPFDAITVSPYMGIDSVKPFIEFNNKWIIILAVTSNKGSYDFQFQQLTSGVKLYEEVLNTAAKWGTNSNVMFVVGATHPAVFHRIRRILPEHFLLVPGIGAQGGDLDLIIKGAKIKEEGILINSSRGIIFASDQDNFGQQAGFEAAKLQAQMAKYFN